MVKSAADLRRTLLDASLELIAKEGLGKLSMREVARRAGVSHQAPYHYFPDREAILAELVAEGFARLRADMLAALEGVDGKARLTAIGKAYVDFALKRPAHFQLMFRSELVQQERHDGADARAHSAFDVLVSVVQDVTATPGKQSDPAIVFAAWSLAHGLATLLLEGKLDAYWGKSKRARAAAADDVLRAFADMVRAKGR